MTLKTPTEWCLHFGAEVIDVDGWKDKPWDEPITAEEFAERWCSSTCRQPPSEELERVIGSIGRGRKPGSPDRQAFLDAISDEPDNYDHRYVYADWLDEHGEHEEADRQRKYETAYKWLRSFADEHDVFYDDLLAIARSHHDGSDWPDYIIDGGRWEGEETPPELWDHYEAVTGEKVTDDRRWGIFSCSC